MKKKALVELQKTFSKEQIFLSYEKRYAASLDNTKFSILPDAVLKIKNEKEIGKILKIACKYKIPITARGGGSSATGASVPLQKGWVLDFSLLNKIKILPERQCAIAQSGAIIADIQKAASSAGLFYPPDPSSKAFCTLGGTIACNASGLRGAKYGVTRDYVLALQGFFANGEKFLFGTSTKKNATGFNMRDLLIGSEGMLGLITQATLRLLPLPKKKITFLASFNNERTSLETTYQLIKEKITPSICEFLDELTLNCALADNNLEISLPKRAKSLLLIEIDAISSAEIEHFEKLTNKILKNKSMSLHKCNEINQSEKLWQVRRICSQTMYKLGNTKLNQDICVPIDRQIELIEFCQKLRQNNSIKIAIFGHAADGNLHVNLIYDKNNKKQKEQAIISLKKLMTKVVELEGVISGEHGIGLAKSPFLKLQHRQAEINAMKKIKKALDPNKILNPGKIFDEFKIWQHKKEETKLPWDKDW